MEPIEAREMAQPLIYGENHRNPTNRVGGIEEWYQRGATVPVIKSLEGHPSAVTKVLLADS